jgi:uncharacterized protein YhaN
VINAMFLNEFLKEHRKNEEQEATIARQQKQIETLTAGLQKVSAQLEASKPCAASRQQQSVKLRRILSKAGWSWGLCLSDQFQRANNLDCRRTPRQRKAFRCACG